MSVSPCRVPVARSRAAAPVPLPPQQPPTSGTHMKWVQWDDCPWFQGQQRRLNSFSSALPIADTIIRRGRRRRGPAGVPDARAEHPGKRGEERFRAPESPQPEHSHLLFVLARRCASSASPKDAAGGGGRVLLRGGTLTRGCGRRAAGRERRHRCAFVA